MVEMLALYPDGSEEQVQVTSNYQGYNFIHYGSFIIDQVDKRYQGVKFMCRPTVTGELNGGGTRRHPVVQVNRSK